MKKININKISEWPNSWAGVKEDVEYGQELIKLMKPFIEELLNSSYSYKTIKNHIDNLWILGGFIIKHINSYKEDRNIEPHFLLTRFIDSMEGPLIQDLSEPEQKNFDRTCRKFYKYLTEQILTKL